MDKKYVMVIDQNRCIGCDCCTIACMKENNTTYHWIEVETINACQKDVPQGRFPDLKMEFLPHLCNHCDNPPCVDACPVGALMKEENGLVILNKDNCDGCQSCLDACPYGVIKFNLEEGVAEKCHFCSHRIKEGNQPFCVTCCEGQALNFGDAKDPDSKVALLISQEDTFVLKPDLGTGPNIYYIPPRPRKRL